MFSTLASRDYAPRGGGILLSNFSHEKKYFVRVRFSLLLWPNFQGEFRTPTHKSLPNPPKKIRNFPENCSTFDLAVYTTRQARYNT